MELPPLKRVESLSRLAPAAARNMSMRGVTVSSRLFQNISRAFLCPSKDEYSCTAMSWRPLSWLSVKVDR